uniref:Uncharacterized protein n=1 Tax=Aegilops tauschii TaxID=37682 RepID=M8AKC4_AEGTA
MEARELENVLSSDKRLPLLLPKFPIMNLVDHDVVCFVLNNRNDTFWLVEVNLRKKALGAVTLYTNEEKENQAAAEEHLTWDDIVRNTFFTTVSVNPISFIPSQFIMYLDRHAIKSLGFSKKLEEEEVKRAIENGWIKDSMGDVEEIC